jgi:tRNA nucleotidyltransferase/poly(A) polymerase
MLNEPVLLPKPLERHPPSLSKAIEKLAPLQRLFLQSGHDLRFVGGCVRDYLLGFPPKDIDLCTDASPEKQIELYRRANLRFIETGIAHGTVTVVCDGELFEVTTLRIERGHDGRRARVEFVSDWHADLARRDLTFNAMALTFDLELLDPFNGQEDLLHGVVRFVGCPFERIREDHLRILRWFRFCGRFGKQEPDERTLDALRLGAPDLRKISRERVWAEMSLVVTAPRSCYVVGLMARTGILQNLDLNEPFDHDALEIAARSGCGAVGCLVALTRGQTDLPRLWKWSKRDEALFNFLSTNAKNCDRNHDALLRHCRRLLAVDHTPLFWVLELALIHGQRRVAEELGNWTIPTFPLNGHDLVASGVERGPSVGTKLKELQEHWQRNGFRPTRAELLDLLGDKTK